MFSNIFHDLIKLRTFHELKTLHYKHFQNITSKYQFLNSNTLQKLLNYMTF